MSDTDVADYERAIDSRVLMLWQNGARSLFELCRGCLGAFPSLVKDSAKRIGLQIPIHRADHWSDDDGPGDLAGLTEPHPLDFEWRFTKSTARFLVEWVQTSVPRGAVTGCFGTPTLFTQLLKEEMPAYLFDRNPTFEALDIRQLNHAALGGHVLTVDLLESDPPSPDGLLDLAVLDPPWYVEHTAMWVHRALKITRPRGTIVTTVFPELLRPSAARERVVLFELFSRIGDVTRVAPDAVYSTPLFERETLAAAGLADLGAWRTGELYAIRILNDAPQQAPAHVVENRWHRIRLGTQVVALRRDIDSTSRLIIRPGAGDGSFLMKSVSSRDPARKEVNLLTSRNRAAIVSDTTRVIAFLSELARGVAPALAMERAAESDREALQTVLALVGW